MGIKNLNLLLTKKCGECITKKNLKDFSNKTVAIDLSIYLYKYLYNNDDHLEGLTRQILRLYKNGITPVYVFDGAPPKEKDDVIKERYLKKTNYINQTLDIKNKLDVLKELEEDNKDDIIKLENDLGKINKKIISVTSKHVKKSKELFELFGVPYIEFNGEAECLCAKLCKDNLVHGCISEDTDILANGGTTFIRNFNASSNNIVEYSLPVLLKSLDITYLQFIDICILCGCDYTTKIKGIGPINAYKYIKKYNNIVTIIDLINNNNDFKKYKIPENFKYNTAKALFLNIDKIDTSQYVDVIKLQKPNINNLINFIRSNSNKLHQKYYNEINTSLIKYYSNTVR
jgi:flap endonuclease-1